MYLHRCFLQIVADYNQVRKKSFPQYFLMVTFVWQAGGKKVSRKGAKAKRKPHQGERAGLKAARNPSTAALCWKSSLRLCAFTGDLLCAPCGRSSSAPWQGYSVSKRTEVACNLA
jgi:hypothetical protein